MDKNVVERDKDILDKEIINKKFKPERHIALLISGEVRTFILKEQRIFFKKLIDYLKQYYEIVDSYIVLKIPTEDTHNVFIKSAQGLKNFKKIIDILSPKYLYCFYDFQSNNYNKYNVQLKMIDMCLDKAIQSNIKYYTFFRIRPDSCCLLQELQIDKKQHNLIYTSVKSDAPANDQIFFFNKYMLHTWWFIYVRPILLTNLKTSPEYLIYKYYKMYINAYFQSWIIRDYNSIDNWDRKKMLKTHLTDEYVFKYNKNYEKLLLPISHQEFIQNMNNFLENRFILDTYIEY